MHPLNRRQRRALAKAHISVQGKLKVALESYRVIDRDGRDVTTERVREANRDPQ